MNNKEFQQLMVDSGLAIPDPNNSGKLVFNVGGTALTSAEKLGNLTPYLVTDPAADGAKTLAGLYAAFTTWKTANPDKQPYHIKSLTGGDGVPGILILYK